MTLLTIDRAALRALAERAAEPAPAPCPEHPSDVAHDHAWDSSRPRSVPVAEARAWQVARCARGWMLADRPDAYEPGCAPCHAFIKWQRRQHDARDAIRAAMPGAVVLALLDALDAAERERDQARADLRKYGTHTEQCDATTGRADDPACDCGYDAARARAEGR